jgi:hypothetical protein
MHYRITHLFLALEKPYISGFQKPNSSRIDSCFEDRKPHIFIWFLHLTRVQLVSDNQQSLFTLIPSTSKNCILCATCEQIFSQRKKALQLRNALSILLLYTFACWLPISLFLYLVVAPLWTLSIRPRIVTAVTLQEIDTAPHA